LLANQGDCGYVPRGEGDGDGADVAEDDMEADAKGEAERVAAGLTGSDEAPTPTAGPTTPGRPVRAGWRAGALANERTGGPRPPGYGR
jgi:hypothetical protein